jgi:hypothetical protein
MGLGLSEFAYRIGAATVKAQQFSMRILAATIQLSLAKQDLHPARRS